MWYRLYFFSLLFSFLWIGLQIWATWSYRKSEAPGSPELKKLKRFNLAVVWTVLLGFSVPHFSSFDGLLIWRMLFQFILNGFTFWLVFDCGYGYVVYKNLWYLGEESDSDETLKSKLGRNAGKLKAAFCLLMMIVAELTYEITLK